MKSLQNFHEHFKNFSGVSKNLFFILMITMAIPTATMAQTAQGIGLKGGLNYNANGDYFDSIEMNSKNPERNTGYHIGLFGKIGDKVYFRPEIVYTSTKSDYDDDTFKLQKLDAPLLVGIKVLGPISVFGGPSLQYIIDTFYSSVLFSI